MKSPRLSTDSFGTGARNVVATTAQISGWTRASKASLRLCGLALGEGRAGPGDPGSDPELSAATGGGCSAPDLASGRASSLFQPLVLAATASALGHRHHAAGAR